MLREPEGHALCGESGLQMWRGGVESNGGEHDRKRGFLFTLFKEGGN